MALGQEISVKEGPCILRLWAPAFFLIFICYISTWCMIHVKGNTWSARVQKYPEDVFYCQHILIPSLQHYWLKTIHSCLSGLVCSYSADNMNWAATSDGFVQTFGIRLAELAIVHNMQRPCVSASNEVVNWEIWQEVLDEMSEMQTSISNYCCRMKAHWVFCPVVIAKYLLQLEVE